MAHHPAKIALIDETGSVPQAELEQIAQAMNEDINTNFGPVWGARGEMSVVAPGQKPHGYWAIRIQTKLDTPGALGYHTDQNNQPESFVKLTNDLSVTISHEEKEMLADPWGNRMRKDPEPSPAGVDPSQFGLAPGDLVIYLVEVCDPPENFSYDVNGISCSDFILPDWYDNAGTQYSFQGNCTAANQVADGGYVSFSRRDGEWFQVFNQNGQLQVSDLGKFSKSEGKSLREWVDEKARAFRSDY